MLTIWGRLNSHNVKKVAWMAEEVGVPHVRHDAGHHFGMSDDYLRLNPNRLIPTIEDDGLVLWESNAIVRYLASRYSADRLWSSDPAVRAVADKWMDWQFSYADAQRDAFHNLVRTLPEKRDAAAVARSAKLCGERMTIIERYLGDYPWLSGDAFGIGDVPMGVYANTWFNLAIDRPPLPRVEDWYARLQGRSGYRETVMIALT